MKKVKVLILRTAGTNCDKETAYAFEKAGALCEFKHINEVCMNKKILSKFNILAIPGGFSYGDDIGSGKILSNEIKHSLKKEIKQFVKAGKLVIGICNGFQVLVKMGLLPNTRGLDFDNSEATLGLNDSGKFEDRWVHLTKTDDRRLTTDDLCIWTKDLPEVIYLPVAHAEGKFIPKNNNVLSKLKKNGQIVFRYCDKSGRKAGYPGNPNGAVDNIAGICDKSGRILGMMPHPERHVKYTQHPHWQRLKKNDKEMAIGLQIFKNGVNSFNTKG
jgi:phosphoribosylformylglycinamidine synthase subunit PurQ / glutaminase